MISLTEEARKELEAYFEGKEKTPIRVYLAPGGCSGPRLALALDEPGEDDETSEDNGLTLCINKELAEKVGAVTVGMTHMGFVVESEIPLPSGGNGGGCGADIYLRSRYRCRSAYSFCRFSLPRNGSRRSFLRA